MKDKLLKISVGIFFVCVALVLGLSIGSILSSSVWYWQHGYYWMAMIGPVLSMLFLSAIGIAISVNMKDE